MTELTPTLVLRAYAMGVFPMAESHDAETLFWVDPEMRGVLPLDTFHIPRRLKRTVRQGLYTVRCNSDFEGVITGCAAARGPDQDTWINDEVRRLFRALHAMGVVHTVECWQDNQLVGGLYGLHLGGAFFGESMFSRARDASKVALVHLVARMTYAGLTLLDTQFIPEHLSPFGAVEIPRDDYRRRLKRAITVPAAFPAELPAAALNAFLDRPSPSTL